MLDDDTLPLVKPVSPLVSPPTYRASGTAWSAYVSLMSTMLGSGIMTLPSAMAATTPLPNAVLLVMTGSMALMSFRTLCLVADATEAYSYEAISTRVFSPSQVWVLRILTVLPCFGSMLMNMLVAVDLLLPFQALFSRTILCLVFALVTFPMCLPNTLHALRMTNTMVVTSVLYIVAVLAGHAYGLPWPHDSAVERPLNSFSWGGVAYAIPIQIFSYGCHLNLVRTYGELEHKQSMRWVIFCIVSTGLALFAVASTSGYVIFQGHPPSNVLAGFPVADISITSVRVVLGVSLLLKMPLAFHPLRDMLEVVVLPRLLFSTTAFSPPWFRVCITTISLGMVTWIAIRTSDLGTAMTWVGTFDGVMFHFVVPGLFLVSTPSSQFATRLPRCATEMGWGVVCIGLYVAVASLSRLV
ncbi:hypothetical protein H257_13457 [Aphanomyces astaci]|uniref:Amino acid transporter transmembrane domain-containing protein n=1 Tax=Aphanomyces astaci TaxID=112090 RepID=W4FUZ9_APHAT|nr:hypothetical protein H257_13457 [Aphanomyces astaci]ETV71330.1 hypothetical protein H257_13457 [Aphanomyces astaci]|eukprot:XP_009839270.1 hypothetical protein H257_13457 [Aphanomyces astaci]